MPYTHKRALITTHSNSMQMLEEVVANNVYLTFVQQRKSGSSYCAYYTVEPLIRDPPRQGQPLYRGHLFQLQPHANSS